METIISLSTRQIYDIKANKSGENQMPCPECSHNRRKKNVKCFSYNVEKQVGYCNHCDTRFVKHEPHEEKHYVKPKIEFQNFTKLSDKVVKYFDGRGISQKTLLQMKIGEKKEWMPQIDKEANCIMFPYYKDGELVNIKYRDGAKNFKLSGGAELVWYNYDCIQKCIDNGGELVINEGECDTMAVIQSGHDYAISVPNGASTGRMEYFDSSFDLLNKVKTFIIATDNDLKGIELKNDLVRRLGSEKCKIVSFKQYKDANEVLIKEGADILLNIVKSAKLIKMEDVYEVSDFEAELDSYYENGLPQGKKIGIPELDEKIRWMTGHHATVTGGPGSGKSEFIDFVCAKLNFIHNWKVGYYSPESAPLPVHFAKVFGKFAGHRFGKTYNQSERVRYSVQDYIADNYFWVAPVDDVQLDEILARFEYLVKAKGCKVFVIDPFNRIETDQDYMHDKLLYIKKVLKKIISFVKRNDALLFLIAHPTKLQKRTDGKYPIATMYDISGSADFNNMTSYGISVRREQDDTTLQFMSYGQISISKAKLNETMGDTGIWEFRYNVNNGRYCTDDKNNPEIPFDNTNWITKEEYKVDEKPLPFVDPDDAFESQFDF